MQTMDTIERVVSADSASPNEDNIDRALRPTLLKDYVGQKTVCDQLPGEGQGQPGGVHPGGQDAS